MPGELDEMLKVKKDKATKDTRPLDEQLREKGLL
jgi:hypothetical protein